MVESAVLEVLQALQVLRDMVNVDQLVDPVHLVLKGHLERSVRLVRKVNVEILVHKEKKEIVEQTVELVIKVKRDLKVIKVRLVPKESVD